MSQPAPGASILARTARGAGWIIGWRMITRLLGVASTLILVRFLVPADFGIIALGAAFVASVEAFAFLGVEDALVREKSPGRAHYDTGFTLNVMRGAGIGLILLAGAAPAAGFFGEPRLAHVLLALALASFLDGFTNIGLVQFRRDLAFDREFRALIVPRLVGLVLMLLSAVLFRSYWALVVGILSQRMVALAFSYVVHPYRPRFSVSAWGDLAGYSAWNWVTALANLVRERSNAFALGHVLGPGPVGVFSLGSEVALLPTTELIDPLTRAAFSGFTAARNEGDGTAESFLRIVSAMMLLTLPAGVGLAMLADPLVRLAFGPLWQAAVPVMQVLAIAGALSVFSNIGITFLSAHAMLRTVLAISIAGALSRVALLVLLLVLWPFGLVGSAWAVALSVVVMDGLCIAVMRARFGVGLGLLADRLWRSFAATAAMAAVLIGTGLGWTTIPGDALAQTGQLLLGSLVGALSYAVALLTFWWLSGRPDGAEAHLLRLAGRALQRISARLRRA